MRQFSAGRLIAVGILSWLTMLGVDFLIHGGLLANLYAQPSPFLLPPLEAFRKIPIGYLSFLLIAVLLLWLMVRIGIAGAVAGYGFEAERLRNLVLGVIGLITASVIITLILQNISFA